MLLDINQMRQFSNSDETRESLNGLSARANGVAGTPSPSTGVLNGVTIDNRPKAVSLFSGAGIGDIGFHAAGIEFIAMCELEPDRAELARLNFPAATVFAGDINRVGSDVVRCAQERLGGQELFLLTCTAPCQGMSKSGQGTLLRNIRLGKRPKLDPRNRLILPALKTIAALRPRFVVFENVIEMRNTVIEDDNGRLVRILDCVAEQLGEDYSGAAYDVEFADYGIPQRRKRLITVYTRDEAAARQFRSGIPMIPHPTHAKDGRDGRRKWVSVWEAIQDFPTLDAGNKRSAESRSVEFHRVPLLDQKKYEWVRHTPAGQSAFDNQCVNPGCGFSKNRSHGATRNGHGINQSNKDTPLYCEACGALLPRPYTQEPDGSMRIMSGYTSAYKRMAANLPAPALTRNLSFACSDHKLHPFQNRVLSLAEAMRIHTLAQCGYKWGPFRTPAGKQREHAPDNLIRLVIGESIPPAFLRMLGEHLLVLAAGRASIQATAVECGGYQITKQVC